VQVEPGAPRAGVAPPTVDDLFIADLCHRVRTPLNGILGSLELLLAVDVPDEARELARAAFEAAADLHRVFESELHAVNRSGS
jgi:signal transduction histidine kinase